jgi:hypothetical protein
MTCTIIGLVVACSSVHADISPANALALMKRNAVAVVDIQTPERAAGPVRPNTPAEALAIMKEHEQKIVVLPIPYIPEDVTSPDIERARHARKFGESPWWWRELYDTWWYDPWVVKPWQDQPIPEPCCGRRVY